MFSDLSSPMGSYPEAPNQSAPDEKNGRGQIAHVVTLQQLQQLLIGRPHSRRCWRKAEQFRVGKPPLACSAFSHTTKHILIDI